MSKIKIVLSVGLFYLLCNTNCMAQFKTIPEEEVPVRVQTFFYAKFNNTKFPVWSSLENIGEARYKVEFEQGDAKKEAIFNAAGKVQEEVSIRKKAHVDQSLQAKSLEKYPDGKVLKETKVTKFNFQGMREPQSYYEVAVKVGKETVTVYFDGDKQPLAKDNVFNLAVN